MAGFWTGFADAHNRAMDRDEKWKLFTEEQQERRRNTILNLKAKQGLGGGTSSGGSSGKPGNTAKLQAYGKALIQMGGDPDKVSALMATGDVGGLGSIVDNLHSYQSEASAVGDTLPDTFVNDALDNAAVVDSTTITMGDSYWEELGAGYGLEFTQEEKDMLGTTQTRPGAIVAPPVTYEERLKPQEIADMREMVVNPAMSQATKEARMLDEVIGQVGPESNFSEEAQKALLDRRMQIKNAIKSSSGDNPNYMPLVGLYGNEFYSSVVEYYPRFAEVPTDPVLATATEQNPWIVPSQSVAEELRALGAIDDNALIAWPAPVQ